MSPFHYLYNMETTSAFIGQVPKGATNNDSVPLPPNYSVLRNFK